MEATTIRADTSARHVNKYTNQNPIHRLSLNRFYGCLADIFKPIADQSTLDFGCGEGYFIDMMAERELQFPNYHGIDLRADALASAARRHPAHRFERINLFDASLSAKSYETVMALEVLEHLFEPEKALARLVELSSHRLVLTVPNEPWFQLMNLVRGRDIVRLGNHPEHVQHWTPKSFASFVSDHAKVVSVQTRFPFIILIADV